MSSMAGPLQISFVLPAYNEEANVAEAIRRVRTVAQRLCSAYEIIVVDDGSADATAERAEAANEGDVALLRHPRNRAYGAPLRTLAQAPTPALLSLTDSDTPV